MFSRILKLQAESYPACRFCLMVANDCSTYFSLKNSISYIISLRPMEGLGMGALNLVLPQRRPTPHATAGQ